MASRQLQAEGNFVDISNSKQTSVIIQVIKLRFPGEIAIAYQTYVLKFLHYNSQN